MDFDIHNQVQIFNFNKVYYMFKIKKFKIENSNNYMYYHVINNDDTVLVV